MIDRDYPFDADELALLSAALHSEILRLEDRLANPPADALDFSASRKRNLAKFRALREKVESFRIDGFGPPQRFGNQDIDGPEDLE